MVDLCIGGGDRKVFLKMAPLSVKQTWCNLKITAGLNFALYSVFVVGLAWIGHDTFYGDR